MKNSVYSNRFKIVNMVIQLDDFKCEVIYRVNCCEFAVTTFHHSSSTNIKLSWNGTRTSNFSSFLSKSGVLR